MLPYHQTRADAAIAVDLGGAEDTASAVAAEKAATAGSDARRPQGRHQGRSKIVARIRGSWRHQRTRRLLGVDKAVRAAVVREDSAGEAVRREGAVCMPSAEAVERRSAGWDGKDCGAEQGGTERQDGNAIACGSLVKIVVHGITFELAATIRSCPLVASASRRVFGFRPRLHGGYARVTTVSLQSGPR